MTMTTTLRIRLSLGEIQECQRHMDVHRVPGDTGELLDFCIQKWNDLNKGLLRDNLMEFASSNGYRREDRQTIHQWFHDISPKWCDRFGHGTSSTFFEFLVPNPGTQFNPDTKHRLVESWLAWVVVQRDQRVYGMVPDIMLFLRSLCDVYHCHFYSQQKGTAFMNHPRDLQLLAQQRIIQQQQWANPQDPAQQQGADPQDPAQQQWAERHERQDPWAEWAEQQDRWAADRQDPDQQQWAERNERQDPWAADPQQDPWAAGRADHERQDPWAADPQQDPWAGWADHERQDPWAADPQDPDQQQWDERHEQQDQWAADPQDPELQDPWARRQDPAPPHPDPAPPRRNRWNKQRPSSSAPVEDPDEVSIVTFRVYD